MGSIEEAGVDRAPSRARGRRVIKKSLIVLWVLLAAFVFVSAIVLTLRGGPAAGEAERDLMTILPFVVLLSFACEYVDSSIGMGYGTTLTPMLLLLGLNPAAVVPAVLVQELISGSANVISHQRLGNVDLRPSGRALRMGALLGVCGLLGGALAARVALNLPADTVKLVTGIIVASMGVAVIGAGHLRLRFSWPRAGALGLVAAINKGFMGGGYGPIVSSGQIVTGIAPREAVAITSFAEATTCAGALAGYLTAGTPIPWALAGSLVAGGVVASVMGAATVRVMPERGLKWAIAGGCVVLGGLTLLKVLV